MLRGLLLLPLSLSPPSFRRLLLRALLLLALNRPVLRSRASAGEMPGCASAAEPVVLPASLRAVDDDCRLRSAFLLRLRDDSSLPEEEEDEPEEEREEDEDEAEEPEEEDDDRDDEEEEDDDEEVEAGDALC